MDPNWTHITRMKKFVAIRKRKDRGTYRLIWHNAEGK